MSTIINSMAQLPWLSQAVTCMLIIFVMVDLILVKFVFKWWNGLQTTSQKKPTQSTTTNNNPNNNSQPTQQSPKNIIPHLIKSSTIIEPCTQNLSLNKIPIILVLQAWMYIILCTDIFIQPGNIVWIDLIFKLCVYLGWNGVVLGGFDVWGRYFWVRVCREVDKHGKLDLDMKQEIQVPGKKKQSKKTTKLPITLYLYYTCTTITSITLTILTITKILNSNNPQNTLNFYFKESYNTLIMFFIMIAILTAMHHIFVGVLAGIFWTLAYVFGIQVGRMEIWEIVLGLRREEKIGEVMGIVEESKENIAHQTYRNHIENLIFTEPSQAIKTNNNSSSKMKKRSSNKVKNQDLTPNENSIKLKQKTKIKSNAELSETKTKKKKQIFSMPAEFTISEEPQESVTKNSIQASASQGKQKVKRKKCYSMEISSKQSFDFSFSATDAQISNSTQENYTKNTKNTKKLFNDEVAPLETKSLKIKPKEPTVACQTVKQDKGLLIEKQIKEESETEDILCSIENRLQVENPIKKSKKINKELKILNLGENEHEIDEIDLSQYVVKDLGQAKANITETQTPKLNFRKKNYLPSLNFATPQHILKPIKEKDSYYVRKKHSLRTPNVSDVKAEGITFCLQDLSKK